MGAEGSDRIRIQRRVHVCRAAFWFDLTCILNTWHDSVVIILYTHTPLEFNVLEKLLKLEVVRGDC